jgi:penicillin-binding protein 1A
MTLKASAPNLSRLLLGSLVLGTLVLFGFSFWMIGIFVELREPIQEIKLLKSSPMPLASEIFDRNGEKIGEMSLERRYFVHSIDLPKWVIDAFLCAEDKTFYKHAGVNFKAMLRALIKNLQNQGMSQGASTITQQLVRIYFLSNERTLKRKIKEVILAILVENNYSKQEILDLYLNRIYLGNRSYGIEAAARNYFRKNAKELTLAEAAILAGIPKSPTKYAPHRNRSNALKRQYWVLGQMVNKKVISNKTALRARHEPLKF